MVYCTTRKLNMGHIIANNLIGKNQVEDYLNEKNHSFLSGFP